MSWQKKFEMPVLRPDAVGVCIRCFNTNWPLVQSLFAATIAGAWRDARVFGSLRHRTPRSLGLPLFLLMQFALVRVTRLVAVRPHSLRDASRPAQQGVPPPVFWATRNSGVDKAVGFPWPARKKRVNPLSLISPWVVALDKDRFFKKLSLMGTKGTCDQLKHQLVKVGGERNARVRTGMERWMVMTVSNIKPVMWWLRSIDRTSSQETAPDPKSSRNQQRRLIAPSTGQTPQLSSPGNRSMSGTNGRGKKI